MSVLGLKSVECAERSIGVREETSNWGKWVQVYLKFVGLNEPAAWCVAFVSYKVHQAAKELGVKCVFPRFIAAGRSSTALYEWGKKYGRIVKDPSVGDIFLKRSKDGGDKFVHVGFVKELETYSRFTTVEGNTNDEGGSEGIEVASLERVNRGNKYVFLRI